MTNAIRRAGILSALVFLLVSADSSAEDETAPAIGNKRTLESTESAWSLEMLQNLRHCLTEGKVDVVILWLRDSEGTTPPRPDHLGGLKAAVRWQDLELQVREPAEVLTHLKFELSDADAAYLKARLVPTEEAFRGVLEKYPGHFASRRALATMASDNGKWKEAQDAFEQLVSENPQDSDTRHRYAFALYEHGDLDAALSQWSAALEADPSHADAWYGCGIAWLGRGIFESAERALRKAVDLNPIHWRAREALIQALIGQGKVADAKPMLELLRERATGLLRGPKRIQVALLPREGGIALVRETLNHAIPGQPSETSPWLFRIEWFGQAALGGKPIKVMELRRDGWAYAWGEVDGDGKFRSVKPLKALPDLEQVLKEAK